MAVLRWLTAKASGSLALLLGPMFKLPRQGRGYFVDQCTVLADDPSLNVRWQELGGEVQQGYPEADLRQPVRVVIDSKNRVTLEHRLVSLPGKTILARKQVGTQAWPQDVEQLVIPEGEGIDLHALMAELAKRNINHIWVEAGAGLAGGLLQAGLVDELILYQAPKLMGSDSRGLMDLNGLVSMAQVPELSISDVRMVGDDIRITSRIKNHIRADLLNADKE